MQIEPIYHSVPKPMDRPKYKRMSKDMLKKIEQEVAAMLHAHRDCLRNRGEDTNKITFDCREGYYGEAFGVFRALSLLGYGYIDGPVNLDALEDSERTHSNRKCTQPEQNFCWWFRKIQDKVLEDEKDGCEYCIERWGKG